MRRSHRLAYLLLASTAAPLLGRALGDPRAELVPVFLAVGAIATLGNVSAVRRLLAAGRLAAARESERASGPDVTSEVAAPLPSGAEYIGGKARLAGGARR
jgi:hypothetical protein